MNIISKEWSDKVNELASLLKMTKNVARRTLYALHVRYGERKGIARLLHLAALEIAALPQETFPVYEVHGISSYEENLVVIAAKSEDDAIKMYRNTVEYVLGYDVKLLQGVHSDHIGVLSAMEYAE